MRNRLILRFVLVALMLAGGFLALRSTTQANKPKQGEPACSMEHSKDCCPAAEPGGMFWENISRQFISTVIVQP